MISPRERKFLLAGGLAALLFVFVQWGAKPVFFSQAQMRAEIEKKRQLLDAYQRILEEKRLSEKQFDAWKEAHREMQGRLFPAERPALASAELQAAIQKLAQASDVEIRSTRFLPPKQVETLAQLAVELSFRATLRALKQFLHRIETYDRLLVVPKITMTTAGPLIQVNMEIRGFAPWKEEKARSSRA